MKNILITLTLSLCFLAPSGSHAGDTEHASAAQRYVDALTVRRLLTPLVTDYVSVVPVRGRAKIAMDIFAALDDSRVKKKIVTILVETYTEQELDAMAKFYGSPLGQSILDKNIDLTSNLNFAMRSEILQAIEVARKRLSE